MYEDELVMKTFRGLTRSLHDFIQAFCVRKERLHFEDLWEECVQEEARVANQEALLRDDDQALAAHAKRGRGKPQFKKETYKESHPPKKFYKQHKGQYKKKTPSQSDLPFESYEYFNFD